MVREPRPRGGLVRRAGTRSDECAPRPVVRVARRLGQAQHRGDAGVGALEAGGPVVARSGGEDLAEPCRQPGPGGAVVLVPALARQPQPGHQGGEELRLDRPDGDKAPVGAGVAAVERGAAVEQVGAAHVAPDTAGAPGVDQRHLAGGSVQHGGIDHLALAGPPGLDQRRQHAEGEEQPAAAEIADQVQRRQGRSVRRSHRPQYAAERDIVDVVPGAAGQRPLLPPAGDAAVDQARVQRQRRVRPQPQLFHHAGAQPLDQPVGSPDQAARQVQVVRRLQIQRDRPAAAMHHRTAAILHQRAPIDRRPGDAQHLGPEIGQQHGAVGPRPDRFELDNAYPRQRSRHPVSLLGPRS